MNLFETSEIRRFLLKVFNDCHGEGPEKFFRASGLGLWSAFLHNLGLPPDGYNAIRHRLLECGFLSVCFDGKTIHRKTLMEQEIQAQLDNINCLMVPCLKTAYHPLLNELGYVAIPGFFNCMATFNGDWKDHISEILSRKKRQEFFRQIRKLGDTYQTQWLSLEAFVADTELFEKAMKIYWTNVQKFDCPAIHYSKDVLIKINRSPYAKYFLIALTFSGKSLVKIVVCGIDRPAKYIVGLVHGIDYDKVPEDHNLYNHNYYQIYEYMHENNVSVFDMGRGFVAHKKRMGANRIFSLYTYLKPLDSHASEYVKTLKTKSDAIYNTSE